MNDKDIATTEQIGVSGDKLFEIEFKVAYEEIRARMDFNRRLLALQVQVLAAGIGGVVFLADKAASSLNPHILEFSCAVLLWISLR